MIVVDASLIIAFLDDLDTHHRAAREIVTASDSFGVHTVNLAETLVQGARTDRLDEMATAVAAVGIHELERLPAEARTLARLRVETGLKLPDCCVVATAEAHTASLATFDQRIAAVAAARGLTVLGVS